MLVLKRRKDETLTFIDVASGEVLLTVKVVDFNGKAVSLGMEADRRIRIVRTELLHETASKPSGLSDSTDQSIADGLLSTPIGGQGV